MQYYFGESGKNNKNKWMKIKTKMLKNNILLNIEKGWGDMEKKRDGEGEERWSIIFANQMKI